METGDNEIALLLKEFINTSLDVNDCMMNKCKIINEKMINNPIYKKTIVDAMITKNNKNRMKLIEDIIHMSEYHNYNQCQYSNCNTNIKKLIIILLKLYDFYKKKEGNKKFPKDVNNAIATLTTAIKNNEDLFDRFLFVVVLYLIL